MSQGSSTSKELEELEKALGSEVRAINIRLREGEYQFSLAKAIASFELELAFPDAKALIKRLYGEKKTEDPQFVAKIQTILKKMEKSGIVRILPKEKPWELQRYVLSSFSFQDVEKNSVTLASEPEIKKTRELIHSQPHIERESTPRPKDMTAGISFLVSIIIVSFAAILWALAQPGMNLIIFVSAFCIAAVSSTALGISIARKR